MIKKHKMITSVTMAAALLFIFAGVAIHAQSSGMKKPAATTVSGILIDMTCAAKGMILMNSDHNALNNDHMTPTGINEACATMCMQGGQPAGIWNSKEGKIEALLLANASANLYKFAAKNVDVQGFWAGSPKDDVKTFFPEKIRLKGTSEWTDVLTKAMH